MAQVAAVMAAISAVVSAAGAVQQGKSAKKMADYQAALADNDAVAARQQAAFDERQHREKARHLMSAQRAKAANGGVLPEEGSPLLFNIDTGEGSEIDALNIRRGGEMQAGRYQSQAALSRVRGRLEQQSGYLSATKSLLEAPSKVAAGYSAGKTLQGI